MIKEFCDICGEEVTSDKIKISVRCDIGSMCGDNSLAFSTLHSDQLTVCLKCADKGIKKETTGIDEDILKMIKDNLLTNISKDNTIIVS